MPETTDRPAMLPESDPAGASVLARVLGGRSLCCQDGRWIVVLERPSQ